ncbi:MAG: phosphoribosylformylglycinamidine synthase [Clostridia bacterium]|nr:phosphoribosylformylglycinamidine synthase [Clostridia bacterium]
MVYRVYVEKKPGFEVEAQGVYNKLKNQLLIEGLTSVRLLNRYDVENIDEALFEQCKAGVFAEPQSDDVYEHLPKTDDAVLAVEYLPGQFDQRADSCAQCIQLVSQGDRPIVKTARVYLFGGKLTADDLQKIEHHLINPVEARKAALDRPETLATPYDIPTSVETLDGFLALDDAGLENFVKQYALAMDADDIRFCQAYFKTEQRDPTITEIRMIDTYWSDHCRHTTFLTQIDSAEIDDPTVKASYDAYVAMREKLYAGRTDKPMTLMDVACIGAKQLKSEGYLKNLDESDEINACSIRIPVDVNGTDEDWLLLFKNETHNHPTEIEPFGGAATCIGGAIRDPLANRGYVYQAMRVTGAADPLKPVEETMPGKLPQSTLVTTAAQGYSSYGNQIGLATGYVNEIYHPGYAAKRMEIGAVVGAVPEDHVRRDVPEAGDVVILLGGRTGRDGCGGATGSSKSHTLSSLETCGAEVQKGNAPEERKLQRLFRNKEATRLIRRCNDFGAGGVSVAIGELADGLEINLDAVPKKYDGLDGTELAISESQERMAVVVEAKDADRFIELAHAENLEATKVATVAAEPRLRMTWNGKRIVDLSREFLNSNGAEKHTTVKVEKPTVSDRHFADTGLAGMDALVTDLNVCSQKGLVERFDSTIGAGSVLMPFGGKYQLTPSQAMVAKLPVLGGETKTCSVMAYGYNPFVAETSPYHSAYLAVVESTARLVAAGGDRKRAYYTYQEYFERLRTEPTRWGKPFAALLGALQAQVDLKIASIGGKDSMSGSFEELDVPPTLVSFCISPSETDAIVSPEFKKAGSTVCLLAPTYTDEGLPTPESLLACFDTVQSLIREKKVTAVYTPSLGGIGEAVFKMCLGNRLGFAFAEKTDLTAYAYGSFVLEMADGETVGQVLGTTTADYTLTMAGETRDLAALQEAYEQKLEPVFPYRTIRTSPEIPAVRYEATERVAPKIGVAKPKVFIPVFPGTNCEYDTARAYEAAGAEAEILVLKNLSAATVEQSIAEAVRRIRESQIIAIPGGFSGGDEPDGSGKFITAFFRNPQMTEAVMDLLKNRDGLMCGICNGFQALVKLGLVPFGEIRDMDDTCPTLTFNTIGRHQSMLVNTRVASNKSPWLSRCQVDDVHTIAISHGEGRFVASDELLAQMIQNGQIATQYVDLSGQPTQEIRFNPNTSVAAIEGITSPDGRVFGKMGHSERRGDNLYKNVAGNKWQPIFEGAVDYFKI